MKKLHIITYGCQMNEDDSRNLAKLYASNGYQLCKTREDADLVIVNSCTVRQHAEDKALSEIGRLKKWKLAKKNRKIIFAGCAAQRLKETFKNRFPFVDEIITAKDFSKIFLKNIDEEASQIDISNHEVSDYLTIMRGCSMNCAYCIVPSVRGPAVSVDFDNIMSVAKIKAKNGIKELILLGQTVNCYKDLKTGKDFNDLLQSLSAIDSIQRIRFMSPHPLFFGERFYRIFAENDKIARHIHLPLQSGSDKILKAMKRGYTIKKYLEIVSKLRKAQESVCISTDFIVGFPGETKKDFMETLKIAKDTKFSFAFCFKYSPRTNRLDDISDVSENEVSQRLSLLMEVIKKNSRKVFIERKGMKEEVLVERECFGKTSSGFNCAIIDSGKIWPGEKVEVEIKKIAGNTLYGKVLK